MESQISSALKIKRGVLETKMAYEDLDEKRKKEWCYCECGCKEKIRHFEKCPNCNSEAFHLTVIKAPEEDGGEILRTPIPSLAVRVGMDIQQEINSQREELAQKRGSSSENQLGLDTSPSDINLEENQKEVKE